MIRIGYVLWDGNRDAIKSNESCSREETYTNDIKIMSWGSQIFYREGFVCLLCYRRKILKGVYFAKDVPIKEDCCYNFALLPRLSKVCQLEYAGYLYRQRANSAVSRVWSIEDRLHLLKEVLKLWELMEKSLESRKCRELYRFVFCLISRELEEAYRARQNLSLLGRTCYSVIRRNGFNRKWLWEERIGAYDFRLAYRAFLCLGGGVNTFRWVHLAVRIGNRLQRIFNGETFSHCVCVR